MPHSAIANRVWYTLADLASVQGLLVDPFSEPLLVLPADARRATIAILEKLKASWHGGQPVECSAEEIAAIQQLAVALRGHPRIDLADVVHRILLASGDPA